MRGCDAADTASRHHVRMRILLSAAIVPLLIATASFAQDEVARTQLVEQQREKLRRKWEQQFRAADTDRSGGLSTAELRAARLPGKLLSQHAEIDTDANGELSPAELLAAREKQIAAQRAR
jgi:hypothetical protein